MTIRATLAEAVEQFTTEGGAKLKLSAAKRRSAETQAGRFSKWYGEERPTSDLKPYDVESYVNTISGNSSDAAERVEGLRNFLEFLAKSELTETNLKSHARAPRGRASRRSSGASAEVVVHKLTAEGHANLVTELENLKGQRGLIAESLSDARADKDFRENAPLDAAREKQALNESRISEIESLLKHAQIVGEGDHGNGISIGSTIVVRNLKSEREQRFTLVHPREVNPAAGRISLESPVGKALLGRAPGDEVQVQAPSGMLTLKIESVEH
ncbi:MAG: hypothetical protein GEU28_09800 [Dehalococcoidia bacterium]|nr:hypothetical protein [Dehalococcoidia bacterium]